VSSSGVQFVLAWDADRRGILIHETACLIAPTVSVPRTDDDVAGQKRPSLNGSALDEQNDRDPAHGAVYVDSAGFAGPIDEENVVPCDGASLSFAPDIFGCGGAVGACPL